MIDHFPGNEIRCNVRPGTICPLKLEKIVELTGDPTGNTEIDGAWEQHLFNVSVLKVDGLARVAEMLGQHGSDIADICPVRPGASVSMIRRGVVELAGDGIRRVTGRQKP